MTGQIITFYSYKGGVGRSFALANAAVVLSQWNYRVLCVDWDLDAPGLSYYFAPWLNGPITGGLVDAVREFRDGGELDLNRYTVAVAINDGEAQFDFIPAGIVGSDYFSIAQNLDWAQLYTERNLGIKLEQLRSEWMQRYDVVLIDSRTGITDIGGICTAQLPDVIVMLFTANRQSLEGTLDVARRAHEARDKLPYDRSRLMVVPVPARFDAKEEFRRAEQWRRNFENELSELVAPWLSREVSISTLINHLTIPYVPYWSFGEEIAVAGTSEFAPGDIGYAVVALASILAHGLSRTELLAESRDSYVSAAARGAAPHGDKFAFDLLISYDYLDAPLADTCIGLLKEKDMRVLDWVNRNPDRPIQQDVARCRHCMIILGQHSARKLPREVEAFIKQSLDDESRRELFPLSSNPHAEASTHSMLRFTKILSARTARETRVAIDEISAQIDFIRASDNFDLVSDGHETEEVRQSAAVALAASLIELGALSQERGRFDEADSNYHRALSLFAAAHHIQGQAAAFLRLGNIAFAAGDLDHADRYFSESLSAYEELHDTNGTGIVLLRLGDIAAARGESGAAKEAYMACLTAVGSTASVESSNANLPSITLNCLWRLGDLAMRAGDASEAKETYLASARLAARFAQSASSEKGRYIEWRYALAVSYGKLGNAASSLRNFTDSLESYETSVEIFRELTADDSSAIFLQRDLYNSHGKAGDAAAASGDLQVAHTHYQASLNVAENLSSSDPRDEAWQLDLSRAHQRLAILALIQEDSEIARVHFQSSLDIATRLAAADPSDSARQRDLAALHAQIGKLSEVVDELDSARASYQAALAIVVRLAADSADVAIQRDLTDAYSRLGDIAYRSGDFEAALNSFQAALGVVESLAATDRTNEALGEDIAELRQKIANAREECEKERS